MTKFVGLLAMIVTLSVAMAYNINILPENKIIDMINNDKASTWEAGVNERFADMSIDEISRMMTVFPHRERHDFTAEFVMPNISSIPTEFDAYKKWPKCAHPVLDQEKCGSCWAFSASEALSDRWCIQGGDSSLTFSAETAISCDKSDMGCNGGMLPNVWKFMQNNGLTTWACEPYTSGGGDSGKCRLTCKDESVPKLYKAKSHYAVVHMWDIFESSIVSKIQKEVMQNGPVQVAFTVYQDFMSYKGGVYQHKLGGVLGGHAVLLVGWGEDNGVPYWKIKNSWGPTWGESGFFKILRGNNECGIEKQVEAGLADV